jgi:hypothetical protein
MRTRTASFRFKKWRQGGHVSFPEDNTNDAGSKVGMARGGKPELWVDGCAAKGATRAATVRVHGRHSI